MIAFAVNGYIDGYINVCGLCYFRGACHALIEFQGHQCKHRNIPATCLLIYFVMTSWDSHNQRFNY